MKESGLSQKSFQRNNNTNKGQRGLENLGSQSKNDDESDNIKEEYNPNRKF